MAAGSPRSTVLAADALHSWVRDAVADLARHRSALDRLNVFPVPDSDTGSNLHLTLRDGLRALGDPTVDPGGGLDRFLRGTLLGARGSSGVIVSQWLAAALPSLSAPAPAEDHRPSATGAVVADAFGIGAAAARTAVGAPVEGTVLTVADALARAAERAAVEHPDATDPGFWAPVLRAGSRSLEQTERTHPVLRAAGVPDAGAWGLLLVVAALARAIAGAGVGTDVPVPQADVVVGEGTADLGHHVHAHGAGGEFEVMFVEELLAAHPPAQAPGASDPDLVTLRGRLSDLGDSVVVMTAGDVWQAHVHTDRPVEVLRLPVTPGRTRRQVSVRHLLRQSGVHGAAEPVVGVVAVTRAPGLVADLARSGAVVLLESPDRPVGDDEVARAVADTGGRQVLVLASGPARSAVVDGVAVEVRAELGEAGVVAAVAALLEQDGTQRGTGGSTTFVDGVLAQLVRVRPAGGTQDPADLAGVVLQAGGRHGTGLVRVLRGAPADGVEMPGADVLAEQMAGALAAVAGGSVGSAWDIVVLDLAADLPDEVSLERDPGLGADGGDDHAPPRVPGGGS